MFSGSQQFDGQKYGVWEERGTTLLTAWHNLGVKTTAFRAVRDDVRLKANDISEAYLRRSYLKPVESAVVFEGEDVVWDGEEVAVCSHESS